MKISELGQGLVEYPIYLFILILILLALGFSLEDIQEFLAGLGLL